MEQGPLINAVDLSSREHRDLLDVVDRFRMRGMSRYVDVKVTIQSGDDREDIEKRELASCYVE
ncbi:MAG: hypothetical protein LQ340_004278 [Diploschistes diacapsis]|nr:MAG: hypothetical protein LQ340_004278 [Diploschistes diacapsis]